MSDREESTKRDQAAGDESSPSASRRQQAEKAAEAKQDEGSGEGRADSGTASRPRGHTEDPDVTL
jgi:hypothetical protein